MRTCKPFFHKRDRKRAAAFVLAGTIAALALVPERARAIDITPYYLLPAAVISWSDEALAAKTGEYSDYNETGLAYNCNVFNFAKNGRKGNVWPLGGMEYVELRPGYEESGNTDETDFRVFDRRHIYCSGNHTSAVSIAFATRMFSLNQDGYRYPDWIYQEDERGKTNPQFNFLMHAIASYYPGDYQVPFYPEIPPAEDADPYAAPGIVSQIITWVCTDDDSTGFAGPPPGADDATVMNAFLQDYQKFCTWRGYRDLALKTFALPGGENIYNVLIGPPGDGSTGQLLGMPNFMDSVFATIWWSAYYTSRLTPNWEKGITEVKTPMEQVNGEYHVYLDLFTSGAAVTYLSGIAFYPYGDWEYVGVDEATGKQHFKSVSGELDENGSIGTLRWPKGEFGSLLPMDMTKAKIYAFDTYNGNVQPHASFGRMQTHFAAWWDGELELHVTIGDDDVDDTSVTPKPEYAKGDYEVHCDRFEHTENFNANYTVNLLKYDSETGKPLANSTWDILEKFDDTQLANTDLDRAPSNAAADQAGQYTESVGTYTSALGSLNSTPWGDDAISTNYNGAMGVNQSDINKYNWGNDENTQFERWDDPLEDKCFRDENVTGEDGLLYEIDSGGNKTEDVAHTDTKHYTYNKGYCTGHPAPTIHYVVCDHEEECDCDEINQAMHDAAWAAWFEEVKTCEALVSEGGFFHCITPGDEAKTAMEADRDQFFKDFISITYEYSAMEKTAAKGYTLHGVHTDDIPLEWRVVTSSEYKDTQEATSLNHQDTAPVPNSGAGGSEENGENGGGEEETDEAPDAEEADQADESETLWEAAQELSVRPADITWKSGSRIDAEAEKADAEDVEEAPDAAPDAEAEDTEEAPDTAPDVDEEDADIDTVPDADAAPDKDTGTNPDTDTLSGTNAAPTTVPAQRDPQNAAAQEQETFGGVPVQTESANAGAEEPETAGHGQKLPESGPQETETNRKQTGNGQAEGTDLPARESGGGSPLTAPFEERTGAGRREAEDHSSLFFSLSVIASVYHLSCGRCFCVPIRVAVPVLSAFPLR